MPIVTSSVVGNLDLLLEFLQSANDRVRRYQVEFVAGAREGTLIFRRRFSPNDTGQAGYKVL